MYVYRVENKLVSDAPLSIELLTHKHGKLARMNANVVQNMTDH